MGFSQKNVSMASLALLIIATFIGISEEIAVMSIDLGSEWMKVAIVSVCNTSDCTCIVTMYLTFRPMILYSKNY